MKTRSMKGEVVDFAYHMEKNADQPALGNALMNARGDQLDGRGNVVKTRSEIAAEYHRNAKSVKQVSVTALDAEMFQTPAEALAGLQARPATAEQKAATANLTPVGPKKVVDVAGPLKSTRKIADAE
ncbi:MAG: hypothetical protein EOP83_01730 [Verrucomicrobiaceae bacterium]|nr:MAG: hypothetical protein EOP83_01730 [Verrucomicrobiaceae bacterium]